MPRRRPAAKYIFGLPIRSETTHRMYFCGLHVTSADITNYYFKKKIV